MEGWRDGWMEGWRDGENECGKGGRMRWVKIERAGCAWTSSDADVRACVACEELCVCVVCCVLCCFVLLDRTRARAHARYTLTSLLSLLLFFIFYFFIFIFYYYIDNKKQKQKTKNKKTKQGVCDVLCVFVYRVARCVLVCVQEKKKSKQTNKQTTAAAAKTTTHPVATPHTHWAGVCEEREVRFFLFCFTLR